MHNTALISAQRNELFAEKKTLPAEWGRVVESAIGAHLLNYSLTEKFSLHYWREKKRRSGFCNEQGGKVIGIEVKSGAAAITSGISAFKSNL